MRLPRKAKDKGPCATEKCWQDAEVAGFCRPCYQSIRYLQINKATPKSFSQYLHKVERINSRAQLFVKVGKGLSVGANARTGVKTKATVHRHRPRPRQAVAQVVA